MSRASWGRLLAVLVVACAVLASASAANAATLTACVNKKSGEMRLRTGKAAKKKCPKGWKKVRWSTTGPAGKQGTPGVNGTNGTNGAPGPNISLRDASGNVIGQFLGMILSEGPIYAVLRDGAVWFYTGGGQVLSIGSPDFKASDCSGTAYLKVPTNYTPTLFATLLGGPWRVTFRTFAAGVFGPTSAWKATTTSESLSAVQLYRRNSSTGVCAADGGPTTGDVLALELVAAPPDFVGPLSFG